MPASFDHILLTRFSVRFTHDQPAPDDAWLQYRWAFFREALASSLSRQTERNFTWLVFCDENAPEWLREEFAELSPGLFTPVWLDQPWSHSVIRDAVSAALTQDQYLITTRIDSDDAVSKRFIEEVQSHFDDQDNLYINLLRGVQVERSGQLFTYDQPANPFISFVERLVKDQPPRTVFQSFRHGESSLLGPTLNVVTAPRWMQVVHGTNLSNTIRGMRVHPRVMNEEFDFELPFTTKVGAGRFAFEWMLSGARLLLTWARKPFLFVQAVHSSRERRSGTRLIPQTDDITIPGFVWLRRIKRRLVRPPH